MGRGAVRLCADSRARARSRSGRFRRTRYASLPLPHLRRAARERHRQGGAPVRLGASRARPRRRAVHRPARPLRADPGGRRPGQPGLQAGGEAARRMGGADRRQGARAVRAAPKMPNCRPAQVEVYINEVEVLGPADELPMPVFGDQEYPGGDPAASTASSICGATGCTPTSCKRGADHRFDPPPHEGGRLLRIPDADPDRVVARGRARLPGAVAAASRQVLRAAAGAAAVQAAHHDRGLRPLFPDRAVLPRRGCARRPLAGRILSARHRDELRHPGRRVQRGRAGAARRVRGVRRRQAGDAEVSAASRMRRRCATTAPTSRTCATRSRCRTSARRSAARASRFSPTFSPPTPRTRSGRFRRRPAATARSATA